MGCCLTAFQSSGLSSEIKVKQVEKKREVEGEWEMEKYSDKNRDVWKAVRQQPI